MNNQESKELNSFIGLLVNGGVQDGSDGQFNPIKDLQEYVPAMFAAQPAFSGLGEYNNEQATMGIVEKQENQTALSEGMSDVPELDRYDLTAFLHGLECAYSLVARKNYQKGLSQGREELIAELKAGSVLISDL